ncbi:hypothetical protein M6D93_12745 [Jatrophihabitans telluris]|uniref:ARB-07466-like C-terminal domain-containing protein n=1 Tax=Jatrophihabitans telluris TaxID=2038343 RepID=A0ABY4QWH3_9ACTN|nr:hypothetical protein [Jatrophihabitans telluris]UQX87166.1 hypothetical protein M6D93_12745 [Jatrophihabitans telluris]
MPCSQTRRQRPGFVRFRGPLTALAVLALAGTAAMVAGPPAVAAPLNSSPAPVSQPRLSTGMSGAGLSGAGPISVGPLRTPGDGSTLSVTSVKRIKAPAGMPSAIEPLATYVGQTSCQPAFRPGTLALGRLLVRTYPDTSFGGDYACGTDGSRSEHYEGRAVDWMNSVRTATGRAQANAVIKSLLATDSAGHTFALARRMGVMYIIWNNRMWGAWSGKWEAYNGCSKTPQKSLDSACHRNHMHISLSWDGALGKTSFFSRHVVTTTDYGPCRMPDLNWASNYKGVNTQGCRDYPKVGAPAHSSAVMRQLVQYSGISMDRGSTGPAVAAVQAALGLDVTSVFDARTASRIVAFKKLRRLGHTTGVNVPTWRALLAAKKPKK